MTLFAYINGINNGLEIVVNQPCRYTAKECKCAAVGIHYDLLNFARIGSHKHLAAVRKAEVGNFNVLQYPPISTCSWLQSNWQASPALNRSGTKTSFSLGLWFAGLQVCRFADFQYLHERLKWRTAHFGNERANAVFADEPLHHRIIFGEMFVRGGSHSSSE